MAHKWTTPDGEVLKAAYATIYQKKEYNHDFRILWTGPVDTSESGFQYHTREAATLMAIECGAGKVVQRYDTKPH